MEATVPLSEHEERERLRKTLKQMGKLKCPSEVFCFHFLAPVSAEFASRVLGGGQDICSRNVFRERDSQLD